MSYSKTTEYYGLPQFLVSDSPKFIPDINEAYAIIDEQLYKNAIASGGQELIDRLQTLEREILMLFEKINSQSVDISLIKNDISTLQQSASSGGDNIKSLQGQINHILIRLDNLERRL